MQTLSQKLITKHQYILYTEALSIEKGPVQTLRFVLIEITEVVKPVH